MYVCSSCMQKWFTIKNSGSVFEDACFVFNQMWNMTLHAVCRLLSWKAIFLQTEIHKNDNVKTKTAPIFLGNSGHMAEPTKLGSFESEKAQHSGLYNFVIARSVTPLNLRINPISATCTWDSISSVITQDSWP